MLDVSERVRHLARLIFIREVKGITREMDYPPHRFMNEPVPNGPNKGHCISQEEIDKLLDEYYAARGWDKEGRPTADTLKKAGLKPQAKQILS